jgi:hypothetical protein
MELAMLKERMINSKEGFSMIAVLFLLQLLMLADERKAAMVGNLLVVLCGDHHVQPVLNTGSLYQ